MSTTKDNSKTKSNVNWKLIFTVTICVAVFLFFAIHLLPLVLFYSVTFLVVWALLFNPKIWTTVLFCAIILFGGSCASEHFWGADATTYGRSAQDKYIKNARKNNRHENRRFLNSGSVWGAQPSGKASSSTKKRNAN